MNTTAPSTDLANPHHPNFYLVVGCPRSGTTLAAREIARHYGVGFPYDTHFIPVFQRWLRLYGDLARENNRRRLLGAIYQFEKSWINQFSGSDKSALRDYSVLATREDAEDIIATVKSYPEMVGAIFQAYARRRGCPYIGAKIVEYEHDPLEKLAAAIPNMKVIHVIRDGRDVCVSWRRTWFGPKSVEEAAIAWSGHIRGIEEWARENGEDYLEIHYEKLIAQPDAEMERIEPFFSDGKRTKGAGTAAGLFDAVGSASEHQMLRKPVEPNNKDKWREQMSERDVDRFEAIAGATLKAQGYEPVSTFQPSGAPNAESGIAARGARFSLTWLRRRVKYALPLFFFVSQLLMPSCRPKAGGLS